MTLSKINYTIQLKVFKKIKIYDILILLVIKREVIGMRQLNIKEIETAVNQYGEIVIRKNNENNVVVMSMEEYNKNILRNEIIKALKKSEEEVENGEGIDSDMAFKELRQKYGY